MTLVCTKEGRTPSSKIVRFCGGLATYQARRHVDISATRCPPGANAQMRVGGTRTPILAPCHDEFGRFESLQGLPKHFP